MNKRNRYKRGKLVQGFILLLFAVILVVVVFKARHIIGKMGFVNDGIEHYKRQQWIEAEESLQRAKGYRWFHYKEEEATSTLTALSWITEYKDYIADLYGKVTESSEGKDLEAFEDYVSEYEVSGFLNLTDSQRQYLLEKYPIDQAIFTGWTHFKASIVNELENPMQGKYNWAKEKIFLVPAQYFSQDKESAILALFKKCDQELYDRYAVATGIQAFRDLIDKLSDIYVTNRAYDFETEWLTPQVKRFMYEALIQKSKEETKTFEQYISAYRSGVDRAYKDEAIEKIVEDFMVEKEKEIEKLLKAKEYDTLITLYKELKYFKDYTKEIEVAEKMQKYEHPEMLLQQPVEQYDFIQTGTNSFDVNQYLIAMNKNTNKLELILFIGEYQDYEVNTHEFNLNDLGITPDEVKQIDVGDYLVGLRVAGTNKAIRLPILRFTNNRLEYLTEFEGDQIELIDDLKHLKITNPSNEAIPYTYDYILGEEGYEKQDIAATPINLSDTNLANYEGKLVKFSCYVSEDSNDGIVNAYYYVGNTFYSDSMAYIYREDGVAINKGSYTVIGEIVSMEPFYNTDLQLEVLRPKIRVLEMQKE